MTLPNVSSRYGAPMGRATHAPDCDGAATLKFRLRRIRINSQGYDAGGAYWGIGKPLYHAMSAEPVEGQTIELFFRAKDRSAARAEVMARYPAARFFG